MNRSLGRLKTAKIHTQHVQIPITDIAYNESIQWKIPNYSDQAESTRKFIESQLNERIEISLSDGQFTKSESQSRVHIHALCTTIGQVNYDSLLQAWHDTTDHTGQIKVHFRCTDYWTLYRDGDGTVSVHSDPDNSPVDLSLIHI